MLGPPPSARWLRGSRTEGDFRIREGVFHYIGKPLHRRGSRRKREFSRLHRYLPSAAGIGPRIATPYPFADLYQKSRSSHSELMVNGRGEEPMCRRLGRFSVTAGVLGLLVVGLLLAPAPPVAAHESPVG